MIEGLKRYWRHDLLPLLADLRLAIVLLLVIAGASATGTVIEQDESLGFYQANYPEDPALFGFLSWRVILKVGLDHVYRTPWFLAILILFGASLMACTFTRQWPIFKVSRRWNYYTRPQSFRKLALSTTVANPASGIPDFASQLKQHRYQVFTDEQGHLYARKGLIGRIGPIIVHFSMILILLGAIWGSISGFKAQEMIPAGETAGIRNLIMAGDQARIPEWQIHVNRFWIDYSNEGRIRQFYSDLSIVDPRATQNDQAALNQTIFVNQPLTYKGVTIYQADWSIDGVKVRVNRSPQFYIPVVSLKGESKLWGAFIPTKPDLSAGLTMVIPDLQGTVVLYDESGEMIAPVRAGMALDVNESLTIYVDEVVGSTGLQIKRDPGIPWVYLGFGLLMLGVMMSYVSHSQVWALQTETGLYVGGKTNRALVTFEREFLQMAGAITIIAKAQEVETSFCEVQ